MKMTFEGIQYFSEDKVVGRVSEFEKPSEFLQAAIEECGERFDMDMHLLQVKRAYCRWYRIPPEELQDTFSDGCYALCEKGRGAFEVFVI